jgi:hypothetical protein
MNGREHRQISPWMLRPQWNDEDEALAGQRMSPFKIGRIDEPD